MSYTRSECDFVFNVVGNGHLGFAIEPSSFSSRLIIG